MSKTAFLDHGFYFCQMTTLTPPPSKFVKYQKKLVQVGTGWYWLVWVGTDWYRLVRIGTDWYRLVQIGTGWYGSVWVGIGWYELVSWV